MKKIIIPLICLVIVTGFYSCEKQSAECGLVPAKILLYDCDRIVFQLLTNENIGDTNWLHVQTGMRFNNVVSNYRRCAMNPLTHPEFDTVYLSNIKKVNRNERDNSCSQCDGLPLNPPQTMIDFTNISAVPCENSEPPARR
jgi:hypothetical protein